MLSSHLPYLRPLGAPQKTHGRNLTTALTREGMPVASWLTMALDRTSWRHAINSLPATPTTPMNYIGRTIVMRSGAPVQGIVTAPSHQEDGPLWNVALDNGKTTTAPCQALKRLLLPTDDRLSWAATALRLPSVLTSLWVRKRRGARWHLGRIASHNTDAKNNEVTWQVNYQDGDNSDYNLAEIAGVLLPPELAQLLENPKKLIGAPVKKMCMRTACRGTILVTFRQKKTKITLWRVQHEDKDSSDYNVAELAPLLDHWNAAGQKQQQQHPLTTRHV
jgi:hypothetical protein